MTRKESRETMMQIIFELEGSDEMNLTAADKKCDERIKGKEHDRAQNILRHTVAEIESIDEAINIHSKSWKTRRMPKVDLAILRLAIGESRFADDVTDAVVISEAINLSKKYSTDQSSAFIHGVLGAILKDEQ